MRRTAKTFMAALCALALFSCNKPEETIEYLEVNVNNISGSWELVEYAGSPIQDDTYMHITFKRNDKTFVIVQNLDSFTDIPHEVTGTFNLETQLIKEEDESTGVTVIRGKYDHDGGLWAHRYIVSDLTADSMTWTALDDRTNVQKFVRMAQ